MKLPVLMYHDLTDQRSAVAVSPEAFREHLVALDRGSYSVLPLGEAMESLRRGSDKPHVAITFDDGYANVHSVGLRALADRGWRATIFVVSDYVGRDNQWPGQPPSIPTARLLDWQALRDLAQAGWEIGGHTRTHPDLTRLPVAALRDEVLGGQQKIEDKLGIAVRHFAYPYGRWDRRARDVVRSAFASGSSTEMRVASVRSDVFALPRLEMWYFGAKATHRFLEPRWVEPFTAAVGVVRRMRGSVAAGGPPHGPRSEPFGATRPEVES